MEPADPAAPERSPSSPVPACTAPAEAEVRALCAARDNRPDALLEILHDVQERAGWIADSALRTIASALNLSRADVHGVVSFYSDFRRAAPPPHVIQLCRAEACQAVGSEQLAGELREELQARAEREPAADGVALEAVYCLGNCALGPAALVDGQLIGRASVKRILGSLGGESEESAQ